MLYYTVCTIEIIVYDQKWIIMEDMGVKSQVIHIFGKISNFAVILCGAWKIILRSGCTGVIDFSILAFDLELSIT